jgi:hypothetical protein
VTTIIEHSVHGLVTIKLINAPQRVSDALVQNIGPSHAPQPGVPDISITFVDTVMCRERVRFLGKNDKAFDDEEFYVLDDSGCAVRMPLDRLGQQCEVTCEPGIRVIPFLKQMLALRLLAKGYVLMHAASFVYSGKGVLVAGWEEGGKTETLLPFMAAGARYIAEENTVVSGTDGTLFGLARPVHLWGWHFRYLPQYWARVPVRDRNRIRVTQFYQGVSRAVAHVTSRTSLPARLIRRFDHELSLAGGARVQMKCCLETRCSTALWPWSAYFSLPSSKDRHRYCLCNQPRWRTA